MDWDKGVAERVREVVQSRSGLSERRWLPPPGALELRGIHECVNLSEGSGCLCG
jgi:hypothetical protein